MNLFFLHSLPGSSGEVRAAMHGGIQWDRTSLRPVYGPEGRYYTYAPSVIVEGTTEHIWSCRNPEDGVIRDHIFYTRRVRGVVRESRSVLSAGPPGAWDSYHTCDPSVVKSRVNYNGVAYRYVMFYLGNDVDASRHNQIGVAFAKRPGGPWTKHPDPLVPFTSTEHWGVGQPSAVSLDDRGRILLFYTRGDPSGTRAYRRELRLGDMERRIVGEAVPVTAHGLTGTNGLADWLNNFDLAYDPKRDRFFLVREQHPYPTTHPSYIGASLQVASIDGASIRKGGGTWRVEGAITPDLTGFPRNHNGGFKRTREGNLPESTRLSVVFARSCIRTEEYNCETPEWSYDLWEVTGQISFP
ncbi:MAG: hypothetical protein KY468_00565 [Armatimonadetes bacterium]|nr:hypothetical protein [Armatimonadota bacterium]